MGISHSMPPGDRASETRGKWTMDLRFPDRRPMIQKAGRYLKEEITHRPRYSAIRILGPEFGLPVIINSNDKIYLALGHPADIFLTRERQPPVRTELGMRMVISYDLQAFKTGNDRFYLPMAPVEGCDALRPPAGGLKAEGMLYYISVFEPVAKQEAETFPLVDLCGAQQQIEEGVFRQVDAHGS
jgi:hypothetical protein